MSTRGDKRLIRLRPNTHHCAPGYSAGYTTREPRRFASRYTRRKRWELEDAMSTPSIEDLERAYKVVRAFTLAAQAYLMGERAEMVRSLDLAVRELEEHSVFTADNLDLLDGVGRVLDQSEIDRAQLGEGFDEELQALRARVAVLEFQQLGAK